MEEWEAHVSIADENENHRGSMSYCGVKIGWSEWYLIGKEHAISCVKNESRVQPCPMCYSAIMKGESND